MSYPEALAAGIPIRKLQNGMTAYYPRCHICGTEVRSMTFKSDYKYTCAECKKTVAALKRAEKQLAVLERTEPAARCSNEKSVHANSHEFTPVHLRA